MGTNIHATLDAYVLNVVRTVYSYHGLQCNHVMLYRTRPLIQAMYPCTRCHTPSPPPPKLKQTAFYNGYSLKDFTIHFC